MPENPTTATQNLPEYSVSELSGALKRTVEEDWGFGQTEARGICIFDGDDDGDNDVLLVRTGPNHYYENVDVGVFEERGAELGLDIDGAGTGCAAADGEYTGMGGGCWTSAGTGGGASTSTQRSPPTTS